MVGNWLQFKTRAPQRLQDAHWCRKTEKKIVHIFFRTLRHPAGYHYFSFFSFDPINRPWDPHRSIADRKWVATSLNESFIAAIGCPLVPKNRKKKVHIFFRTLRHPAGYPYFAFFSFDPINRPWDPHRSIADRKLVATSLNESFTAAIGCPLVPKNRKKIVHIFFLNTPSSGWISLFFIFFI